MENTTNFQPYRCVLTGGIAEITEKKSRFIATVRRTESEEEAVSFIEEMKKKYWDASHNCSAFVIGRRGQDVYKRQCQNRYIYERLPERQETNAGQAGKNA